MAALGTARSPFPWWESVLVWMNRHTPLLGAAVGGITDEQSVLVVVSQAKLRKLFCKQGEPEQSIASRFAFM